MSTATTKQQRGAQAAEAPDPLEKALGDAMQSGRLSPELMAMKMEHETIMTECRIRPRDFEEIKDELEAQLKAFPFLSEDAIYCKPVGKDEGGQQKYARGLSIRAAEVLAECYRWNKVRTSVTPISDDEVKVEASFFDYQNGRIWDDSGVLSKWYKARGGAMQKTPDDRFFSVVCKAEVSRRVREVILRSVNAGLKAWFEDFCEKMIDGLLDDKTVEKIIGQFSNKGVTVDQLEKLVGKPRKLGWTTEDRKQLLGVWNAIKDGETSIDEAFGTTRPNPSNGHPPAPPSSANGAVSGQHLVTPPAPKPPTIDLKLFLSVFNDLMGKAESREKLAETAGEMLDEYKDKIGDVVFKECSEKYAILFESLPEKPVINETQAYWTEFTESFESAITANDTDSMKTLLDQYHETFVGNETYGRLYRECVARYEGLVVPPKLKSKK